VLRIKEQAKNRKLQLQRLLTKNQAEAVVFQTEKLLKESGDKMKEEDKKVMEERLEELKKANSAETPDFEDINKKMESLNEIAQKIGTEMYSQQAQANQGQANSAGDTTKTEDKKEGTVDGDFEEKKDEKTDDKVNTGDNK